MILIFGGTTEGRMAAETLDAAGKKFYYSTRGESQQVELSNGVRICGGMDAAEMSDFIVSHDIRLIVDAAHPFAANLRSNIHKAAEERGTPVVRVERKYSDCKREEGAVWCGSFEEAVARMKSDGVRRLLALTGVQTVSLLKDFWRERDTYFRVLDRKDSIEKAQGMGIALGRLRFYDPSDPGGCRLMAELKPDAVITKESGESGGFTAKVKAAKEAGIRLYIVERPTGVERSESEVVFGRYGLRRTVERLLPGFFDLRSGFTTGSCATAAAVAALQAMQTGRCAERAEFTLPDGEPMWMAVAGYASGPDKAWATVVKDAGDDPDVTDGCHITAHIRAIASDRIEIRGGEGVGTVTLPGLGLPVGESAINPTPRKMIEENLRRLRPAGGLEVEIIVEEGRELASKTFNPKVGVTGGISILGTTGIVMPFSHEAFIESMEREISVAVASGTDTLVINSGARSEKIVRRLFPSLPAYAFIHYGNAIGSALEAAEKAGVKNLVIGIMIGKAVKFAEGKMNTHSHNVSINRQFVASIGRTAELPEELTNRIATITMARELWDLVPKALHPGFYREIEQLCRLQAAKLFTGSLRVILVNDADWS